MTEQPTNGLPVLVPAFVVVVEFSRPHAEVARR